MWCDGPLCVMQVVWDRHGSRHAWQTDKKRNHTGRSFNAFYTPLSCVPFIFNIQWLSLNTFLPVRQHIFEIYQKHKEWEMYEMYATDHMVWCELYHLMSLVLHVYRVPTLPGKPWKPGILSFSFPGLENAWNLLKKNNIKKSGKNLEKREICKFYVSNFTFQDVIYKNKSDLLICHIYIINTNTDSKPNWPWLSLLLPGNNLENIWSFVSQEKWELWCSITGHVETASVARRTSKANNLVM